MANRLAAFLFLVPLISCQGDDSVDPLDQDGDGFRKDKDPDGDTWEQGDCNDLDASVHPGADEIPYDDIDQDCSGSDLTDVDRDGHDGGGGDDCDDTRADISPSAVDVCGDGIDQDCVNGDQVCGDFDADQDGWTPNQGDCNDDDPTVSPGEAETPYNGVDDDCDLATPDDDLDQDGWFKVGHGDCDDDDATVFPGADEVPYDGIDQDCSGSDEDDLDNDGFAGGNGPDCDDARPDINPDQVDVCSDGVDQDCSGSDLLCDEDIFVMASVGDPYSLPNHENYEQLRAQVSDHFPAIDVEFRDILDLDENSLEEVDLYLHIAPVSGMDEDERDALLTWVEGGGNLWLVTYGANVPAYTEVSNFWLEPLGMQMDVGTQQAHGPRLYPKYDAISHPDSVALMDGVDVIAQRGESRVETIGGVPFADLDAHVLTGQYGNPGNPAVPMPMAVHVPEYGAGQVVVVTNFHPWGDEDGWWNALTDESPGNGLSDVPHQNFLSNLLDTSE